MFMMLNKEATVLHDIVRRYRHYNPETGRFDLDRGVREYARLLKVSPAQLSQVMNGITNPGVSLLRRLAQAFPEAAPEIGAALACQDEPIEVPA